jgi:putative transposase
VEIRKGRHVVYLLHAHLVFVTKRRGKVFGTAHLRRLEEIFRSVRTDFEVILKEFNGEWDHVHLLVNYPPMVRLSELVNSLKGVSSRRMKQEFPAVSTFWSVRKSTGHLWSELFRGVRGRSANHGSPPVHRGPEPASGRCALSPGPEEPGTSRLLIGQHFVDLEPGSFGWVELREES